MSARPFNRLLQRLDQLSRLSKTAVVDDRSQLSFAALDKLSREWAQRIDRHPKAGARVGLLMTPGCDWVAAFFALQRARRCVVPLSPSYPEPELSALTQAAAVSLVVCDDPAHAARLSGSAASLSSMTLRADDDARTTEAAGRRTSLEPRTARTACVETDEALALFTSGTTGRPKLVTWSSAHIVDSVGVLATHWGMTPADVLLHTLPLHHLHGICVALLQALLCGATTRFCAFDPARVLNACTHASVLMAVPTHYHRLLAHVRSLPPPGQRRARQTLSSLRLLTSGSAQLPEALGREMEELSGQYPLERYGMTELGIVLSNPLASPRRPGCCGEPLPGVRARIVTDDGTEAAAGQSGELQIAAPWMFGGYVGQASARADFDGEFFKTGDTACTSDGGFIRILGRTSVDIIKSGGFKLSALELEELLRQHPAVDDVAVVGLPDEEWGQVSVAVVVAVAGVDIDGQRLREWCKRRIAPYKVPRKFVFHGEVSRNAMGKIDKPGLLRELGKS